MILERFGDNLFDSHSHINSPDFEDDREAVVAAATTAGLSGVIDVGIDLDYSQKAIENAGKFDNVYAAIGIDPQVAIPGHDEFDQSYTDEKFAIEQVEKLRALLQQHQAAVAMIGETGMDFFYNTKAVVAGQISQSTADESARAQENLFRLHLRLAEEFGLPLTVHSRAAEAECAKVVAEYSNTTGIFHSYTGDLATAKKILDAGWGLGINGIITFKNAEELRSMYRKILGKVSGDWSPSDFYNKGIFFETDAPYLAPEGNRGERNEPAHVKAIYEFVTTQL